MEHEQLTLMGRNDLVKDFVKQYTKDFVAACSLHDGGFVFGSSAGELVFMSRQFELKYILPSLPSDFRIVCLERLHNGFLVGGSGPIICQYCKENLHWQRNDRDYGQVDSSPRIHDVVAMASLDEELLCLGLAQGELASISLQADRYKEVTPAGLGFHAGPVLDATLCLRKPLMATLGIDGWLKVWNY